MTLKAFSLSNLITALLPVVEDAGRMIMQYYQCDNIAEWKVDDSPVTEADRVADRFIVTSLRRIASDIPVVSEEGDKPDVTAAEYFWLVDPLDGTRSFIKRSGYFTVNIGLVGPDRAPQGGIIYDPLHKVLYWGYGQSAFRRVGQEEPTEIHALGRNGGKGIAIVSHANLGQKTLAFLDKEGISERIPCASSIKFCRVAEGMAHVYPRFGTTMEWDTAAGHAILQAAGGSVVHPDGTPFLYGKHGFENGPFIACCRQSPA